MLLVLASGLALALLPAPVLVMLALAGQCAILSGMVLWGMRVPRRWSRFALWLALASLTSFGFLIVGLLVIEMERRSLRPG
jgi:hypothetical protein